MSANPWSPDGPNADLYWQRRYLEERGHNIKLMAALEQAYQCCARPAGVCFDPALIDGPLLCENCGKPMADHDDMARCWVRALPDHSDGSQRTHQWCDEVHGYCDECDHSDGTGSAENRGSIDAT